MNSLIDKLSNDPAGETEEVAFCPLCGSSDKEFLFWCVDRMNHLPGKFGNVRCNDCGLVRLSPRPTHDELAFYYPETDYYSYSQISSLPDLNGSSLKEEIRRLVIAEFGYPVAPRAKLPRFLRSILKWIFADKATFGLGNKFPRYVSGGRALDIGCGSGVILSVLKAYGWAVQGVELSKSAAKAAKEFHDIDVFVGELADARFGDNWFDFIIMNHSLEHLPNVNEILTEVRRILKPGGSLYVEVPNVDSLSRKISGEFWLHWDAPRHLYSFSTSTLRQFLEKSGFGGIRMRTIRADFYHCDIAYEREDKMGEKLSPPGQLQVPDRIRARALRTVTSLYFMIVRNSGDYISCFVRKNG